MRNLIDLVNHRLWEFLIDAEPTEWFIGYELLDNGDRYHTVLKAYSKDDALDQFHDNFWLIAFHDPDGGPPGVDPDKYYEIVEIRPATETDRRD